MDCLNRVSRKNSLLINVDKTKVMKSDVTACHILIQNEQLEQVDTFLYLGSLITEGECTTEFRARLNTGQVIGSSLQKIWKMSQYTDFNEGMTKESTSVACSNVWL